MLKQHCEVCDRVIPDMESYKTVHFGRGHNPNVNTGYDPMVICKGCWKKMWEAVRPGDNIDDVDPVEKTMKKRAERAQNLATEIVTSMVKGSDKACEQCMSNGKSLLEQPCCNCTGKDKWEEKCNAEA